MRIYATVDSVLFTGYNWKELQMLKPTDLQVYQDAAGCRQHCSIPREARGIGI